MSNIWSYELLFPHPTKISISDVEIVAKILNRYGFSLFEPHSGTIHGFRIDEEQDDYSDEFTDLGGVADWFNNDGGLIQAWNGMTDLSLSFTTHQFFRVKDYSGSTVHGVCLMDISVDASNFHDGDPDRDQLADDILNIFTDLCDSFHAIYGYSLDENYTEMIINKPYYVTSYDFTKDPQFIFWVNYFPREYIEKIQPSLMEVPGAMIQNSLQGVVVSYASKPWGIPIHVLKLNNEYARNWFLGKDRTKKVFGIWIKLATQVTAAVSLISLVLFFYFDYVSYHLSGSGECGVSSPDTPLPMGYVFVGAMTGPCISIIVVILKLITDYLQMKAVRLKDRHLGLPTGAIRANRIR